MKLCWLAISASAVASASALFENVSSTASPAYKNAATPIEERIRDLMSRMTIADKAAQLIQGDFLKWINYTTNAFDSAGLVQEMKTKAGQFYVGYALPADWISGGTKRAQDYLVSNTTLGIPAFVQSEGIHGFLIANATIFNSPIGYACSFNPGLIQKMAGIIAKESLAVGVNQIFGPLADLARELRFGRVEETFGEDPFLAGEMAYSYVKGLQANNVSAMVKHFAGFSAPEQGLNTGPVHGGERELRSTWLPPFKRAIVDAGAYSIMSAYHAYDGVPAVADHHTLTDILRGEWDYQYFVSSDAGATDRLCDTFKMCRGKPDLDMEAITMLVLPAGNDVEMGGGSYSFKLIPQLVEAGRLSVDVVDKAVSRVLRAKFAAGLFEQPYRGVAASELPKHLHTPEAVKLAQQLDAESIVLLENRNNVLPLKKTANVAVIGPMADFMNYGDYVVYQSSLRGVTPLQAIRNMSTGRVTYAKGCERWSTDESGINEAVNAAQGSDVAIVVVGTWSRDQNELWAGLNATTGEHVDVSTLNLYGAMPALVKAIIQTGKPTIVVYSSGKPITEPWISRHASALVQQFYPSEQGGNALASILYGDVNPSGKLSVSFPHDVGTLPVFYDYLNSGRSVDPAEIDANGTVTKFGHQYVTGTPEPIYEFGYGKSYTTFSYTNVSLSSYSAKSTGNESITATVRVTNTGSMDGAEVVQLYVQDLIASVVVPNKSLKGFQKVFVKKGESVDVNIVVKIQDLGLWDARMKYVVEPGAFVFWIGTSSKDMKSSATLVVR
ncbi:hypothetical protein FKW77_003000 [Venturia effusa]|uniref:beta-glucosidase n=1 Tax=Venturia effusa TaxID=50376 RepID=A0A517LNK5_9PEZI|nr:hypothetical protein FKW77_003000 [Venturia effusa]